jgi:glycosyltransferase involved in cell wall biosynthesis
VTVATPARTLDVSVVVCTWNRAESLGRLLASLAATTVPPGLAWEVLVVDNNSTDDTRAVVERAAIALDAPVRRVFEPTQGLCHARNRGIRESRGDIVAFLDDDVVVAPDWLARVVAAFRDHDATYVGGRVVVTDEVSRPAWWDARYEGALGACDHGDRPIVAAADRVGGIGIGANMSIHRRAFETYGTFRPDLGRNRRRLIMGDDHEICVRLMRGGERVIYCPDVVVRQVPDAERLTRRYLLRWHFRLGEGHALLRDVLEPAGAARILGVRRTLYRSTLAHACHAFGLGAIGRGCEAFYHLLQVVAFVGYVAGVARSRRA